MGVMFLEDSGTESTESRTDEVSNIGMMGFGSTATGLSHFFQFLGG